MSSGPGTTSSSRKRKPRGTRRAPPPRCAPPRAPGCCTRADRPEGVALRANPLGRAIDRHVVDDHYFESRWPDRLGRERLKNAGQPCLPVVRGNDDADRAPHVDWQTYHVPGRLTTVADLLRALLTRVAREHYLGDTMVGTGATVGSLSAPERPHLKHIEGLRATAALIVYVNHAFGGLETVPKAGTHGILSVFSYSRIAGHLSVTVFIVISGFCLAMPLLAADGQLRGGALTFFKRRARRILPLITGRSLFVWSSSARCWVSTTARCGTCRSW